MEQLKASIEAEIKTGRIGTPVFLRCFYQVNQQFTDRGTIETLINLANSWMHSEIEFSHFREDDCQTTVLLQFADGESALLSANYLTDAVQKPIIDLHMIGSRGTIYHQGTLEHEYV